MKKFLVEQYEIWSQKYEVEANSEEEAILEVLDGNVDALNNELEYIETAEDIGLPKDFLTEKALKFFEKNNVVIYDYLPSIRSVREM